MKSIFLCLLLPLLAPARLAAGERGVSIAPLEVSGVAPCSVIRFTVQPPISGGAAVSWAIEPKTGLMMPQGFYEAPRAYPKDDISVTVTASLEGKALGTSTVKLKKGAEPFVCPTPALGVPGIDSTATFELMGTVEADPERPARAATWKLEPADPRTSGAIDAVTGKYSAPRALLPGGDEMTVIATYNGKDVRAHFPVLGAPAEAGHGNADPHKWTQWWVAALVLAILAGGLYLARRWHRIKLEVLEGPAAPPEPVLAEADRAAEARLSGPDAPAGPNPDSPPAWPEFGVFEAKFDDLKQRLEESEKKLSEEIAQGIGCLEAQLSALPSAEAICQLLEQFEDERRKEREARANEFRLRSGRRILAEIEQLEIVALAKEAVRAATGLSPAALARVDELGSYKTLLGEMREAREAMDRGEAPRLEMASLKRQWEEQAKKVNPARFLPLLSAVHGKAPALLSLLGIEEILPPESLSASELADYEVSRTSGIGNRFRVVEVVERGYQTKDGKPLRRPKITVMAVGAQEI
jgi:hypothetical protein